MMLLLCFSSESLFFCIVVSISDNLKNIKTRRMFKGVISVPNFSNKLSKDDIAQEKVAIITPKNIDSN